jgi:rubrerythrin
MRTLKVVFVLTVVALFATGCTQKPVKSIENLKKAITGETGANAKYTLFAKVAQDEGYPNISKLFTAAAAAEAVHIKNHNAALVAIGEQEFTVTPDPVTPGTTAENLKNAIDGETYECTTMYPEFFETAKTEKSTPAITTFGWAKDAERKHADLYTAALSSLTADGNDNAVSATWYLCPKCGNLYGDITNVKSCEFCATNSSAFQQF